MSDIVDTEEQSFADVVLPQRTRDRASEIEPYIPTIEALPQSVKPAYSSSRSGTKRRRIDPDDDTSSLASPTFQKQVFDALLTTGEEVAHILPHDAGCAVFWDDVAVGVLGPDTGDPSTTLLRRQSMIHGSLTDGTLKRAAKGVVKAVRKSLRKRTRRNALPSASLSKAKLTGLKHCALNKIQLMEHKPFDQFPYMILVPIWDVAGVLGWSPGESYSILCMVGNDDHPEGVVLPDYRYRFENCEPEA